jgi:hypothetical protein
VVGRLADKPDIAPPVLLAVTNSRLLKYDKSHWFKETSADWRSKGYPLDEDLKF